MTDRRKVWDSMGADIKTWTIGPDGISADGEEDTNHAIRFAQTLPEVVQAFLRKPRAEAPPTALEQELRDFINRRTDELQSAQSESAPPAQKLPPNPMPMSRAIEEYRKGKQAAGAHKARTAGDKANLLHRLATYLAAADAKLGADPYVHEVATHHLVSFLNEVAVKRPGAGVKSDQARVAAPKTVQKRLSDLSSFFDYARLQLQATLEDHSSALRARRKDSNTASSRRQRHYKPYTSSQLGKIFEPHAYLAFNRDADYFWGPLLALHLGARLGEIVTLRLDAVQQQPETGIWCLTIIDAKNENSKRTIPVSQPLVRLGFGNYVRHLRRLGAKYLFPHRDMTTPELPAVFRLPRVDG